MAAKLVRCARCKRRLRSSVDAWAVAIDDPDDRGFGVVTAVWCPDCTTDEEHIEREINDATSDYVWSGERVACWPKRARAAN